MLPALMLMGMLAVAADAARIPLAIVIWTAAGAMVGVVVRVGVALRDAVREAFHILTEATKRGGDDGAIGLTGNFSRFQSERVVAPLDRFLGHIEHISFPLG